MADLLLKRIKDWATSITSFRTGDVMPVDGPSGTAKITFSNLVAFVHNAWAAFINALTSKDSFENGDKIPVVNGSTATAMEASNLLELTAQNAVRSVNSSTNYTEFEDGKYFVSTSNTIGDVVTITKETQSLWECLNIEIVKGQHVKVNTYGEDINRGIYVVSKVTSKLLLVAEGAGINELDYIAEEDCNLYINNLIAELAEPFVRIVGVNDFVASVKEKTEEELQRIDEELSVPNAPIYDFETPAGYEAHTKSTSVSEVSLVETPKTVHFDGVNVERNSNPCVGDALYIDGDGNKHFITGNTYVPASLPSGYTSVGVVGAKKENQILILHKTENTGVKFVACWQQEMTGIADRLGTEITIQFRQAASSGSVNVGLPLVFTPQTLAEAVAAIDAHLRANPGGIAAGAMASYDWHCELMENYLGEEGVVVVIDNATNYLQASSVVEPTGTTSGVSSTTNMCNFLPAYGESSMLRVNGGFGSRPGWNYERFKQYVETNTSISTLTSMVPVNDGSNFVNRTQFETDQYCADLRAAYETFEKYVESLLLRWPCRKGAQWSLYGTGKECTYQLASKTNKDISGTIVDTYPLASWVKAIAADSDGLRAGDWYLPQLDEFYSIFGSMKLDGSDLVNATLKKMTGSARSLFVSRWLPVRASDSSAWFAYSTGHYSRFYFNYDYLCDAVALLTINP